MRVLVACEFSGTVRRAFREAGHDAWSCDLLPAEDGGEHIQGDALGVLGDGWDMMIAHPPCTYLSRAGARWLYGGGQLNEDRVSSGVEARVMFDRLLNAPIPMVAVENPTPLKIYKLPLHSQAIQPFEFGHPYSKRTLLWLRGLPSLVPTDVIPEYGPFLPSNTGKGKRCGQASSRGVARNAMESSRTFPGIAAAMASQWGGLAVEELEWRVKEKANA